MIDKLSLHHFFLVYQVVLLILILLFICVFLSLNIYLLLLSGIIIDRRGKYLSLNFLYLLKNFHHYLLFSFIANLIFQIQLLLTCYLYYALSRLEIMLTCASFIFIFLYFSTSNISHKLLDVVASSLTYYDLINLSHS